MNESVTSIHDRYKKFTDETISNEQILSDVETLKNDGYKLIRGFAAASMVGHGSDRLISQEVDLWMGRQRIGDSNVIGPMAITLSNGEVFIPPRSRAEWQPEEND